MGRTYKWFELPASQTADNRLRTALQIEKHENKSQVEFLSAAFESSGSRQVEFEGFQIETCAENFPRGFPREPAGNPPEREQEVRALRGDPAGRKMLSREYSGEGFNFEGNPAGKFMST
jgi:hypothetical protein